MDFAVPGYHRVKMKESEILGSQWGVKKAVEHESDSDVNCS